MSDTYFMVLDEDRNAVFGGGTQDSCEAFLARSLEDHGETEIIEVAEVIAKPKAAPVKPTGLEPHEDRVVAEAEDLAVKLQGLLNFINSGKFTAIGSENQELLGQQAPAMMTYLTVLRRRIARFKR